MEYACISIGVEGVLSVLMDKKSGKIGQYLICHPLHFSLYMLYVVAYLNALISY